MFEGVKSGWEVFKASFKVFGKYPSFIVPLIIVWLFYAPMVIYLKWFFPWGDYSFKAILGIIFMVIFIFALLLMLSCSVLLELIQQIETGKKPNIAVAWGETVTKNMIKIIPLAFVWAVIWFILTIIEAMLRRKDKEKKDEFNARNVAKTLGNFERFSWWRLSFDILKKAIRMIVFLIMPAFAWENLGFFKSIKRGFAVFKAHLAEFATGFTLTYLAATLIFLPAALLLYITAKLEIALPDWVWFLTILYIAFAWSYSIYLEQMFVADLYLWHLSWERAYTKAQKEGKELPWGLWAVKKPSILDDFPDLLPEPPKRPKKK